VRRDGDALVVDLTRLSRSDANKAERAAALVRVWGPAGPARPV